MMNDDLSVKQDNGSLKGVSCGGSSFRQSPGLTTTAHLQVLAARIEVIRLDIEKTLWNYEKNTHHVQLVALVVSDPSF